MSNKHSLRILTVKINKSTEELHFHTLKQKLEKYSNFRSLSLSVLFNFVPVLLLFPHLILGIAGVLAIAQTQVN